MNFIKATQDYMVRKPVLFKNPIIILIKIFFISVSIVIPCGARLFVFLKIHYCLLFSRLI